MWLFAVALLRNATGAAPGSKEVSRLSDDGAAFETTSLLDA